MTTDVKCGLCKRDAEPSRHDMTKARNASLDYYYAAADVIELIELLGIDAQVVKDRMENARALRRAWLAIIA